MEEQRVHLKEPKSLMCPHCNITLTRPSHLARHIESHLPRDERLHVQCPQCRKHFTRHDVLARHLRTVHMFKGSPKTSAQKSCSYCVGKKLKCDRNQPCHSCAKHNLPCIYPSKSRTSENRDFESASESETLSPDKTTRQLGDVSNKRPTDTSMQAIITDPPTYSGLQRDWSLPDDQASDLPDIQYQIEGQYDTTTYNFALLDTTYAEQISNPNIFDFNDPIEPQLLTDFGSDRFDIRIGGLDWLSFETGDSLNHQPQSLDNQSHFNDQSIIRNSTTDPIPGSPSDQFLHEHGQFAADNSSGLSQFDAQPWPFAHTIGSMPRKYELPPIKEVLHGILSPEKEVHESSIEGLIQLMSSTHLPNLDDLAGSSLTPAVSFLKRAVDMYFVNYHCTLPIVHLPTWNFSSCSTVLLAAMACIGAIHMDEPNASRNAWCLSEICIQLITWLGSSDSTNYHDIEFLSASCLHQIYSLGSGNRQLYQNADRSRGMLIGSLRGMGLLKPLLGMEPEKQNSTPITIDSPSLTERWITWRKEEQEIRVTWGCFEYECSLCTLTSRRAAIDLSELPRRLPCADALWEAPSAQIWAALMTKMSQGGCSVSLPASLRDLLAGRPLPGITSPWGKRLHSQVIGRLLWDLKQLEVMSMSDYLGLQSLHNAQRQSKVHLLTGFGRLTEAMSEPGSTTELISFNISRLIYHYSHLYTAEDIMDLIVCIVQDGASQKSKLPRDALDLIRRRLESKLGRDPRQTRKLVWHAAQIIAVANEYLVSTPCEILRIFMGYLFIIAFARHSPQVPGTTAQVAQVRLDEPCNTKTQKTALAEWIKHGGPARIGSAENICTDQCISAISQQAQTMLQNICFWGLSRSFMKILESL